LAKTFSTSDLDYLRYQTNRGFFRALVRKFYLRETAKNCIGKVIDFGCGAGSLLQILPAGSIGFEINPVAVDFCQKMGLNVFQLNKQDIFASLYQHATKNYSTFVMSHVLEHIAEPELFLRGLLKFLQKTEVRRLVFVLPGQKGFLSDKTHNTFIDRKWFEREIFAEGFKLKEVCSYYYPVNSEKFGRFFTHNEWHLILEFFA
jgi:cyclopropane fatty-acyl-phospholipid synthase-like methyltransferase